MKRLALFLILISTCLQAQKKDALLFYLSGEKISADFSEGQATPNFANQVSLIPDGVKGSAIRAHLRNSYSYLAPGNIFANRGTICLNWRSGSPLGKTEFPIWRVSFAEHSSWDMVWLRIDWNGHGYDAFVTDNNLARVRVSTTAPVPAADEWVHLAFSWDEEKGVKLYLNGNLIAQKDSTVCLDTGLDQFGPHQRIISPYQVQSAYIVQRGGDIDEVRIYDHSLTDAEISAISKGGDITVSAEGRKFRESSWNRQYGFSTGIPPYLKDGATTVRKVEIKDSYDYKRWFWKACDGIKETTWPGVYNRSKIVGRSDYFQLPDWDCYSFSGKTARFIIPEQWNYVEVTGGAFGEIAGNGFSSTKAEGSQKTFHKAGSIKEPCELTFTNKVQETPIQEFNAFKVTAGDAPKGILALNYKLFAFDNCDNPELQGIEKYIDGRYAEGRRSKLLAKTWDDESTDLKKQECGSPIVHIVIPYDCKDLDINRPVQLKEVFSEIDEHGKTSSWSKKPEECTWRMLHAGLDGIRIELPALDVKPTAEGELFPMNVAVMDPIQPMRYMMDFSFSVKPGEARTLWLDLRDRILPDGKPLYLTISGSGPDFDASKLAGTKLSLIFKEYDKAKEEHITDRFNQVRDNYAVLVEENTSSRRYSKFRRFENDLEDLLKVAPEHPQGLQYKSFCYPGNTILEYKEPVAPKGIPEWAFLQLKLIGQWKYLAKWYLDNRRAPNGEFGGGLSDDTSLTEIYVGLSEMGIMQKDCSKAVLGVLQAVHDNGMVRDGISAIKSDGLHTFEEGENVNCQAAVCEPDDSLTAARLLTAARGIRKHYLGVNGKGQLLFKGDYFGYGKSSLEDAWAWSSRRSLYHMAVPLLAADRYGDEFSKEYTIQFFNTLLSMARKTADGHLEIPTEINFNTGEGRLYMRYEPSFPELSLFANLWKWTGDSKYLEIANLDDPRFKTDGDYHIKDYRYYLKFLDSRMWYNTHGSPYIDRVRDAFTLMDYPRLGGSTFPRPCAPWNLFAWRFQNEEDGEKLAINSKYDLRDDWFEIEFFITAGHPVKARMLNRRAADGIWEVDAAGKKYEAEFGKGHDIEMKIPAGKSYTVKMKLKERSK